MVQQTTQGAKKPRNGIGSILALQAIIIIFTFSGVFGKLATTGNEWFSPKFLLFVFLDLVTLGVYALLWQQALKRFDLHVAYSNRATSTVWGLVWAAVVFGESITVWNVVGTAIILVGTFLVNSDA